MDFINSLAGELILWAGGITALGVIWKKAVWPFLKAVSSLSMKMHNLADDIPTLQEIAFQFRPNGGDSLHDHITKIQSDVGTMQIDLEEVKDTVNEINGRAAANAQKIAELEHS